MNTGTTARRAAVDGGVAQGEYKDRQRLKAGTSKEKSQKGQSKQKLAAEFRKDRKGKRNKRKHEYLSETRIIFKNGE